MRRNRILKRHSVGAGPPSTHAGEAAHEVTPLPVRERTPLPCASVDQPYRCIGTIGAVLGEIRSACSPIVKAVEACLDFARTAKGSDPASPFAPLVVRCRFVSGAARRLCDWNEAVASLSSAGDAQHTAAGIETEPPASFERVPASAIELAGDPPTSARLDISMVPASAPGPFATLPPPRTTRICTSPSGSYAGQLTHPPKGSPCGTPSRTRSAQLDALPPSERRVTPWLVG